MPRSEFSGTISGPKVEVAIDLGNPLLNVCVDGFLKIGTVWLFIHASFQYKCFFPFWGLIILNAASELKR